MNRSVYHGGSAEKSNAEQADSSEPEIRVSLVTSSHRHGRGHQQARATDTGESSDTEADGVNH
ncbi:MAG: hypothetical protein PHX95_09055 [Lachnospiraceae bacterium]|nr:hypothetical protein [Lachnospiraceae bacterium]